MKNWTSLLRFSIVAALDILIAFGIPMLGQEAPLQKEASAPKQAPALDIVLQHNIEDWILQGRGVPEDWSHHHLIFSSPGTEEQAIENGTHDRWLEIVNDPRFILQQIKRSGGAKVLEDWGIGAPAEATPSGDTTEPLNAADAEEAALKTPKSKIRKDWSEPLITGNIQPNMYPAKYGASLTTASCSGDYVAYPTGTAGTGTTASIVAYYELYSSCTGSPSVYWAYNTGGTISNSPIISQDGTQVAFIQSNGTTATLVLLKWLQSATPPTGVKGTFTSGSTTVTITSGTVTASDVGMQISGIGIPANDTIASVSGSTITLATATTASETAETLTITAETVTTPGVAPTVSNASYRSCTAPCMTTLAYANSQNDTFSAPFYDYASDDALYVGDNNGYLHQFKGVFGGMPAESVTPWPVQVNTTAGTKVSSPVYDAQSGYVFVGDSTAVLHAVGTGTGSPTTTNGTIHGTSSDLGDTIIDAPLVDSSAGTVYPFVTTNSGGDNAVYQFSTGFTSGTGNAAATGTETGIGGAGYYLYAGTFDNVYYQSTTTPPSGNLYMVGGTGLSAGGAILYQIPVINSTFVGTTHSTTSITVTSGTVTAADVGAQISGTGIPAGDYITAFASPTVTLHAAATSSNTGVTFNITGMGTAASAVSGLNTSHYPWPSPLTEFCNNGTSACAISSVSGIEETTSGNDYVFFSIHHSGLGGCSAAGGNGCILAFNISHPTSVAIAGNGLDVNDEATEPACWVTGGLVIDNSSTTTGASQIYFVNLNGNGAGGPTRGTYTGANCGSNIDTATIQAVQAQQSSP